MKLIAFYLPQYHRIKENDEWWGEGFTDWVNVAQARPRFRGHRQPQIPSSLGFYDLLHEDVWDAQAKLAKTYGIDGFCQYHYYFNGDTLLEEPLNHMLASGKPDLPFCLCWANENWTRRWDGGERHLLMEQRYETYDVDQHIGHLAKAFTDHRYMQADGRPIWLIYDPGEIPNIAEVVAQWRDSAKKIIGKDLYLIGVQSFQNSLSQSEMIDAGFDATVQFFPGGSHREQRNKFNHIRYLPQRVINELVKFGVLPEPFQRIVPNRYSYAEFAHSEIARLNNEEIGAQTFPGLVPSWDNSARRKNSASTIIQNDDPGLFQEWLEAAIRYSRKSAPAESLVFINAWNEWAEGCHLEPDVEMGERFLEAVRDARIRTSD